MEERRRYKCAACGMEFEIDGNDKTPRCPNCGNKTLILLKGTSRRKKGSCVPSG